MSFSSRRKKCPFIQVFGTFILSFSYGKDGDQKEMGLLVAYLRTLSESLHFTPRPTNESGGEMMRDRWIIERGDRTTAHSSFSRLANVKKRPTTFPLPPAHVHRMRACRRRKVHRKLRTCESCAVYAREKCIPNRVMNER